MNDTISRQAAIDALEELKELDYELYIRTGYSHLMEDHWDFVIKRYKEAIKETPCVQQKTGRWLVNSDGYYPYCSLCKNEPQGRIMTDYCPNCGAKMKE